MTEPVAVVPARNLPIPDHLSPVARMYLAPQPAMADYPALDDKAGWRAYVDAVKKGEFPAAEHCFE